MTGHEIAKRIFFAGVLIFASSVALADAIDGDWCAAAENKHFRIAGPNITTPSGQRTTGDYSRHAFFYVVPDGDSGAGEAIAMQQLNDDEVQVSVDSGAPKIWRRCKLTS